MPTREISFFDSPPDTPQRKIYDIITEVMRFMSINDFVAVALATLSTMPLPDGQFMRIKYAVEWKLNHGYGLDDILRFVFYGNWQDVGLTSNATENALDESSRSGLMQVLYGVAVTILAAKIAGLTEMIHWQYETPDWVITEEPVVPEEPPVIPEEPPVIPEEPPVVPEQPAPPEEPPGA